MAGPRENYGHTLGVMLFDEQAVEGYFTALSADIE
jgi:hypothetical protein